MSDRPMWHVPETPGSYIVDRRRRSIGLAHREIASIVSVEQCRASDGLRIWIGEFDRAESVPKGFSVGGLEFRRLLDHFYLPAVPDTPLAVALFDLCADAYDRLVDVPRNIENIQTLLRVVLASLPPGADPVRVLDFGCGTGLAVVALRSFDPRSPISIQLTGTDRSPHMLQKASQRGLHVLAETEWMNNSERAFDATIASYVVHLGLSLDDCRQIARKLRPGGVFAANYHHAGEADLAGVALLLTRAGLSRLALPYCDDPTAGNPTLLFRAP